MLATVSQLAQTALETSMPLVHRRGLPHNAHLLHNSTSSASTGDDGDELKPPRFRFLHIITCLAVVLVAPHILFLTRQQENALPSVIDEKNYIVEERDIQHEASLLVKLKRGANGDEVAHGPHKVELKLTKRCSYPRFWMRLVGDALVRVDLEEQDKKEGLWTGSFSLPTAGSYHVDARWYGCSPHPKNSWTGLSESLDMTLTERKGVPPLPTSPLQSALFADSAWIADKSSKGLPARYVWKQRSDASGGENSKLIQLQDSAAPVVVEGTTRKPGGFYLFNELGNYELVCFAGSQTMSDIRDKFLDLRPHLFRGQRVFKFHYYNVTDFVHPDTGWSLETKQRLRKCKHILVSMDEMKKPVSQEEYREQVTTFVGHLLKLLNDETFPIWVFTVNEPPMQATNCFSPKRRTTDHPCNDVLKDLFRQKTFPDQVHLLDNTDLTLAQFDENRDDILAIIALRVFVFVGKRVEEWRAMGQKGMIDGLHRKDVVEPNFELIPYEGWA